MRVARPRPGAAAPPRVVGNTRAHRTRTATMTHTDAQPITGHEVVAIGLVPIPSTGWDEPKAALRQARPTGRPACCGGPWLGERCRVRLSPGAYSHCGRRDREVNRALQARMLVAV